MPGPGQTVAAALTSEPDIRLAYLFGSQARGEASEGSDVDVALLADGPVDLMRLGALQELLSATLRKPVDLVDLRTASPLLAWEIVRDGAAVLVSDAGTRMDFELDAVRRWEDTRHLRRQQQELLGERARLGRSK